MKEQKEKVYPGQSETEDFAVPFERQRETLGRVEDIGAVVDQAVLVIDQWLSVLLALLEEVRPDRLTNSTTMLGGDTENKKRTHYELDNGRLQISK